MKYDIFLLGKTKDSILAAGIDEYLKRLKHYASINLKLLKVKKIKGNDNLIREKESELLLANIPQNSLIVALDAQGSHYSSMEFSQLISKWEGGGVKHVSLLIGGPFGLSTKLLNKANYIVSLSRMTFTHDMARLFLIEQLYRAYTIKAGEKYHK